MMKLAPVKPKKIDPVIIDMEIIEKELQKFNLADVDTVLIPIKANENDEDDEIPLKRK